MAQLPHTKIGDVHNDLTAKSFNHKDLKTGRHVWLWTCKCGNEVLSTSTSVRTGNRKSCGCRKIELCSQSLRILNRKPEGESCRNNVLGVYKRGAKDRNLSFMLTEDEFFHLITQECYYCGSHPTNQSKVPWNNDVYYYSGIDRLDSKQGYSIDNVVPSCKICNIAKQTMSQQEFISWIAKVYDYSINNTKV